ncbi:Protein phosphatase 2C domain-containing protein OS=Streptomyces cyaneofuscatus OX=66883 GN=G3I52_20430 PE=4 SV=1 [Streptomyces cyaneofuscatus]
MATVDARLRNKEGGFFTAAADPAVAARAVTGTVPADRVRSLAALTDGASRWAEVFREGDWAALLELRAQGGAPGLIDRVRELEEADAAAGRVRLRRGKTHDDATAVYAEL